MTTTIFYYVVVYIFILFSCLIVVVRGLESLAITGLWGFLVGVMGTF